MKAIAISDEGKRYILDNYGKDGVSVSMIAKHLGLPRWKVQSFANANGKFYYTKLADEQNDKAFDLIEQGLTYKEIAEVCDCTITAIARRASTIGLSRQYKWDKEKENYLLEHYDGHNIDEIAHTFGTTERVIYTKLRRLGLVYTKRMDLIPLYIPKIDVWFRGYSDLSKYLNIRYVTVYNAVKRRGCIFGLEVQVLNAEQLQEFLKKGKEAWKQE